MRVHSAHSARDAVDEKVLKTNESWYKERLHNAEHDFGSNLAQFSFSVANLHDHLLRNYVQVKVSFGTWELVACYKSQSFLNSLSYHHKYFLYILSQTIKRYIFQYGGALTEMLLLAASCNDTPKYGKRKKPKPYDEKERKRGLNHVPLKGRTQMYFNEWKPKKCFLCWRQQWNSMRSPNPPTKKWATVT